MESDPLEGCDDYRVVRPATGPDPLESFIARDVRRDSHVLVRLFPVHLFTDDSPLELLRTSASAVSAVADPHVAEILEVGRTPAGRAFIVTELGNGRLLREELRQWDKTLPVLRVLDLVGGLLEGLGAAHEQGIVHGGLSPDSLLLGEPLAAGSRRRLVKVLDFGVPRALEQEGVELGVHREARVAESAESSRDARGDLFSVGVILYELLAGRGPFEDHRGAVGSKARGRQTVEPPSRYSSSQDTGPELDAVVLRSLEPDPEDGYQSAKAFRVALEKVAALLRQVSLPGNLYRADDGFAVQVPLGYEPDRSGEPESVELAFPPVPRLDADDGDRAISLPEGTAGTIARARSGRSTPRPVLVLVAAALVAIVIVATYLVR